MSDREDLPTPPTPGHPFRSALESPPWWAVTLLLLADLLDQPRITAAVWVTVLVATGLWNLRRPPPS